MKQTEKRENKVSQMKQVGTYLIYLDRVLGEGQYGTVYESSEISNFAKRYAAKVIPSSLLKSSRSITLMIQKEIEVLKMLSHESLVCLHYISQTPNNLYIFLDFCNGGNLAQYIYSNPQQKLSESESLKFFKQFVDGYYHLYQSKIIHRDIKPENLMLHNGLIKIGDFGFCRYVEGEMDKIQKMSIKCTPAYASPQLLQECQYSSKCDVWSSGCLLYKMLFGDYPFTGYDIHSLLQNIVMKSKQNKFPFPLDPPVSEEVKKLLRGMFKFEESDRVSWEDLFNHTVLSKKQNVLVKNYDCQMTESSKENLIFQTSDFQVRNQTIPENVPITTSPQQNAQNNQPQAHTQILSVPQYHPYKIEEENTVTKQQFVVKQNVTNKNTYDYQKIDQNAKKTMEENNGDTINLVKEQNNLEFENKRLQLKEFHEKNMKQLIEKTDKMILFLRNQALFADETMRLVFTAKNKYQLPSLIFYELIYSLTGFYNFHLDHLHKLLNQTCPNNIFSDEDFQIYLSSKIYKRTFSKIKEDSGEANKFFQTLSSGILKEIQKQLYDPSSTSYEQIKDFEKFIKLQSTNINEYKTRFSQIAKQALQLLNPDKFEKDLNSLRGIRGIQLIVKLDVMIPVSSYLTFDFLSFYDQYMNKIDANNLLSDIQMQVI